MPPSIERTASEEDLIRRRAIVEFPDLLSPKEIKRARFIDNNGFRNPEDLTAVFDYHSVYEPFTTEEELIFAQAFKHNPKEFAAIAEVLPNRTTAECAKHYYAKKSDGRFKTESLKQREAKRGPKKDVYDYGEADVRGNMEATTKTAEDRNVIPIDQEIKRLRAETGEEGQLFSKRSAPAKLRRTVLPHLDLSILHQSFRPPLQPSDEKLLVWLRSADVLPLLKQWQQLCLDDPDTKAQMEKMLRKDDRPWTTRIEQVADHAMDYGEKDFAAELKTKWTKAFVLCANYASKIVKCNRSFFEGFKPYGFPEMERMTVGVAILSTVYDDLNQGAEGFFGTLLESPLAQPMAASVRKSWEAKFLFEGEEDSNDANIARLTTGSQATLLPNFSISRLQPSSQSMKQPDPPTCNNRTKAPHGKEIDAGSTSDEDDSDSSDEFGEPRDAAARRYKAKADGLYHAMKKMVAKLREVEAERDEYKAQLEDPEVEPEQGAKRNRRLKQHHIEKMDAMGKELKAMTDANFRLRQDNNKLRKALNQDLRGRSSTPEPIELTMEEAKRAMMDAGYKRTDRRSENDEGEVDTEDE